MDGEDITSRKEGCRRHTGLTGMPRCVGYSHRGASSRAETGENCHGKFLCVVGKAPVKIMSYYASNMGHIFRVWSRTPKQARNLRTGFYIVYNGYIKAHGDVCVNIRWYQCRDFDHTKLCFVFSELEILVFVFSIGISIMYALFQIYTYDLKFAILFFFSWCNWCRVFCATTMYCGWLLVHAENAMRIPIPLCNSSIQ